MKTSLLSFIALVLCISLSAQKTSLIPAEKAAIKAHATLKPVLAEPTSLSTLFRPNDGPRTVGVDEVQIGSTIYDLQSNSNVQNRIYAYPDGTVGAVWTQGYIPPATAFSDRGTGYNYFDGTSWGEIPTARIASETKKNGWPSYSPMGAGEMIVSHTGASGLYFTSRPVKGTGDWTSTIIPGTASMTWPRAIAVGNTIHILVNSGAAYQGLTNALLYFKSTDGGATFTGPTILPGLEAAALNGNAGFTGFGGDDYSWAPPQGDTIAFVCGTLLGGVWIMKSFDAGVNWTKIPVFEFPHFTSTASPDAATFDEVFAMTLDNTGKAHFAGARYKLTGMDATASPVSWFYYPYTDGIVYWNEDMPVIDSSYLNNPDTLANHGMWIGSMVDVDNNGTIDFPTAPSGSYPWGDYRYAGLSSFPQIVADKQNNIFVSYSALREDLVNSGANPNVQLYRHLYLTSKLSYEDNWCDPRDLTDDIIHSYDECVWASMSYSTNDKLHFVYQLDPEPGTAIGADADEFSDNYINYLTFPTFVALKPVDISKDVVVSPNPATDYANVQIQLKDSRKVDINVYDGMGRLVVAKNFGQIGSGTHSFKIDTESLPSGVYLFNIRTGANQTTKKVIVN